MYVEVKYGACCRVLYEGFYVGSYIHTYIYTFIHIHTHIHTYVHRYVQGFICTGLYIRALHRAPREGLHRVPRGSLQLGGSAGLPRAL